MLLAKISMSQGMLPEMKKHMCNKPLGLPENVLFLLVGLLLYMHNYLFT